MVSSEDRNTDQIRFSFDALNQNPELMLEGDQHLRALTINATSGLQICRWLLRESCEDS